MRRIFTPDAPDPRRRAGAPPRIIKFKPRDRAFLADGTPLHDECEDGEIRLHVPREQMTAVCPQLLTHGAVDDRTIHDVPLEDVITKLFSRRWAAAK